MEETNGNGYFKGNVEARICKVEKDIDSILTNHLPHIQDRLDKIQMWIIGLLGTTIAGLLYIILTKR